MPLDSHRYLKEADISMRRWPAILARLGMLIEVAPRRPKFPPAHADEELPRRARDGREMQRDWSSPFFYGGDDATGYASISRAMRRSVPIARL